MDLQKMALLLRKIVIISTTLLMLTRSTKSNLSRCRNDGNDGLSTPFNNRPIIGILAQECSNFLNRNYSECGSYIAASYVKFVESAGARVVPIWIGKRGAYYENILRKINGVLFPGGNALFTKPYGYAEAGYKIYRIAKKINDKGGYFPIFGICLGFELLTYLAANKAESRIRCSSNSEALPLNFQQGYRKSRLFKNAPDILHILQTENVTINFHNYCTTIEGLANVNLTEKFRIISLNQDKNGTKFVSSLEHRYYPFYGIQFHPEKNIYEWIKCRNIPHNFNAVRVGQYFANFFVNEARKSDHRFLNSTEEESNLIYNYPTTYTGSNGSVFEQSYLFPRYHDHTTKF